MAAARGIALCAESAEQSIWFRYRHPLARPDIFSLDRNATTEHKTVVASDALVFGMIEGRPRIKADRIVYDPQDGSRARRFDADGSEAGELTIVASYSEGVALTGKKSPSSIAASLLRWRSCVGVVLKCGPQGALVATHRSRGWVRAFPSDRVWKIGSGDVFSAAFAHAFLKESSSAIAAAWFASRIVSLYVATRQEQWPKAEVDRVRAATVRDVALTRETPRKIPKKHVYLAAPFFTTSEQWMVDEARAAFTDMGFKVFSPIHDVGEGPPREVAPADLHGLEESGLVFALLDGLDPGTLFEVGYARALQIPVVGVSIPVMERSMTMLLGSGCSVFDDFSTGVYAACWKLMGDV